MPTEESQNETLYQLERGRIPVWLEPDDVRWIADHFLKNEPSAPYEKERHDRIKYRSIDALEKARERWADIDLQAARSITSIALLQHLINEITRVNEQTQIAESSEAVQQYLDGEPSIYRAAAYWLEEAQHYWDHGEYGLSFDMLMLIGDEIDFGVDDRTNRNIANIASLVAKSMRLPKTHSAIFQKFAPNERIRERATQKRHAVLTMKHDELSTESLIQFLTESEIGWPKYYSRLEAVRELGKRANPKALKVLREIIETDTYEYDAWGLGVGTSMAEFAQEAVDQIKEQSNLIDNDYEVVAYFAMSFNGVSYRVGTTKARLLRRYPHDNRQEPFLYWSWARYAIAERLLSEKDVVEIVVDFAGQELPDPTAVAAYAWLDQVVVDVDLPPNL